MEVRAEKAAARSLRREYDLRRTVHGCPTYDELTRLDVLRGRRRLMIEGAAVGGLRGCVVGREAGDGGSGCAAGALIGGVALGLAGRLLRIDQWREVELPGGG